MGGKKKMSSLHQSVFGIRGDAEREGVGGAGISRVDGVIRQRTSRDFVQVPTPLEGTGRRAPVFGAVSHPQRTRSPSH